MLFYDFEVFSHNWLVVVMDTDQQQETVIIDDPEQLEAFHATHKRDIWVGFNSRHYDQYILKAILCGFNPKKVNDFIIIKGEAGWKFSSLFRRVPLNNYDVMMNIDRGLKSFEGFMGNDIKESSVPFDIDRPLTPAEIDETVEYCRHDVEQTMEVFLQRKDDFEAKRGLVRLASGDKALDMSLISLTNPQLSAQILGASRREYDDEFDIDFPSTMRIEKYTSVLDWYRNPENRCYDKNGRKNQLDVMIAGVPHQFGYGGVHGAIDKYHGKGNFLNMDVASLYPSLMIKYGLGSRSMKNPAKYEEIYNQRLQYKREGNPLQASLKLVLNSTYGVMKDKTNALFDPRQANRVCIYGQILLLDLIERLEPHCQLIQSNTDGVLIKMPDGQNLDDWYALIDDIAYDWEQRTALTLEFDEFKEVYQKDVNNYIIIPFGELYDEKGKPRWKSKGAYVKKLSSLDYDLPIINHALVDYMVKGVPIEKTINGCDDLKEFQLVTKISGKYTHIIHGDKRIKEKCIRVFASKDEADAGVQKIHAVKGNANKMPNSPLHCFMFNDEVNGVKVPAKLNKQWYIDLANKRLGDFGI
jgi:DNA polymerase